MKLNVILDSHKGEILNFEQQTIKNKASKCRRTLREKSTNNPQLLKEIKSLL